MLFKKKEYFNPLHHLLVEKGGMFGFEHTQGKLPDTYVDAFGESQIGC